MFVIDLRKKISIEIKFCFNNLLGTCLNFILYRPQRRIFAGIISLTLKGGVSSNVTSHTK